MLLTCVTHSVPLFLSPKFSLKTKQEPQLLCFPCFCSYNFLVFSRSVDFSNKKMTNQNVVVSNAQSGFSMEIVVSIRDSSALFPPTAAPKPLTAAPIVWGKAPSIKMIEAGAGAWVDSIRASSPTRRLSDNDETNKKWILDHPSALSMFDEIVMGSKGKQIVMFLDYDGTLSPIVADPDRAVMSGEMRKAVKDVAHYFPTAIVSGRCRTKVFNFVKLAELYYAGSHGMDIKGPTKGHQCKKSNQTVLCQPAREFLPMIDEVYKLLVAKTKSIPGSMVENNKFCLSVHFRCVDEKRWGELAENVKSVLKNYPELKMNAGRKVLEIRPTIKWDKGNALEFLLESLGFANSNDVLPIYIGDDRTDEDAFKVLRKKGQGFGILVSKVPKETNASYTLQEPSEVMCFLKRLVEWKKSSLRKY